MRAQDYLASLLDGTTEINRVGKPMSNVIPRFVNVVLFELFAQILLCIATMRIERLFLSGNNLGVPGAQQLCSLILDQNLHLARLDLRHNNLAVAENKTINRIDLSANGITAQAAPAIAQAIGRNERLARLDLRHNDLGDSGAVSLAEAALEDARSESKVPDRQILLPHANR
eukprot:767914-Hanusia_phi.AAC.1